MKKIIAVLFCLMLITAAGCTSAKPKAVQPKPPAVDTAHLTAEDKGVLMTISRGLRTLPGNVPAKEGYEMVTTQVTIENNSKQNVAVSPDFVTLKMIDGNEYKYSSDMTASITSKAAFKKVTLPPDYRGGGLLLFEVKKGSQAASLSYKDKEGRNMVIKLLPDGKENI